jgi:RNA polymerase sigma-70 factor, ECF subfamily
MSQRQIVQSAPVVSGDAELVRRALARNADALRQIMQRYNRRLYRIARGILRNSADAEDAVQDAYVAAFTHLASYRGKSTLTTWLSRIVMNEALGRLRRRQPTVGLAELEPAQNEAEIIQFPLSTPNDDPERTMAQRQILQLVEQATDNLPDAYRLVFVARVIEEMSVEETSELLGIKPETVKTRLHRARQLVRCHLNRRIGPLLMNAFPFAGRRCERMTEAVMQRLGIPTGHEA